MNIVILTRDPFPYGMAATKRIGFLAKSLSENDNISVIVLSTRVLPKYLCEKEIPSEGIFEGIKFFYTTKTVHRSRFFLIRRFVEVFGIINSLFFIGRGRLKNEIDCIYLWETIRSLTFLRFIYLIYFNLLRIPVVQELNELPWSLKEKKNIFELKISPLLGISGTICISSFLKSWSEIEIEKQSKQVKVIKVPILIDAINFQPKFISNENEHYFLFSGAPEYRETIFFILNSMQIVWKKYKNQKLKISGFNLFEDRAKWLIDLIEQGDFQGKIEIIGYVSNQDLEVAMSGADALLIPLFHDQKSEARFPTKISEYLLSGRPLITCKIGEIQNYLQDGINALITETSSIEEFSKRMIFILDNPIISNEIGLNGRQLALKEFDYRKYSKELSDYFQVIKGR